MQTQIGKKAALFLSKSFLGLVVLKKETPGFIVNRMLAALVDEAYELYDEGIADFEDIDIAIKKGLNHPLGPFELSDYSGLDIHYYAKLKKFKESGDPKDEPKKFLEEKVLNGDLGVKTGKGFYQYKKDQTTENPCNINTLADAELQTL